MSARPAFFFDRDGVVNVSPGEGYVLNWPSFHFSEGIIPALQIAKKKGYALVLVTSQQGVGKGLMSQSDLDHIHAEMQKELAANEAQFDLILACTHLAGTCTCRKPSPEMIHIAEAQLGLDLSRSWLVGDHDRDIQMAQNAGIPHTIRILSYHQPAVRAEHTRSQVVQLSQLLNDALPHARPQGH